MTIGKDEKSVVYMFNANGNAMLKKWQIAILASATVDGGTAYASSQLADLEIAPAFVGGKIVQTNTLVGTSVKLRCELEQKTPFEGKAEVRLMGLPGGANAEPKYITKEDKEIFFEVNTTTNAVKGMHRSLFVAMDLKLKGQPVTQTFAGSGALRLDGPRAQLAEARPATPATKPGKSGK
jgi:hypothetical protein